MKTIVRLFFAGLLVVSIFAFNVRAFAEVAALLPDKSSVSVVSSADIEVFVRNGCPHCAKAELFLQALKREQPALTIIIHDVAQESLALEQLQQLVKNQGLGVVRVPAFQIGGQLIIGFSDEITSGQLIRSALAKMQTPKNQLTSESCEAEQSLSCEAGAEVSNQAAEAFFLDFFGHRLALDEIGLPLFTLAMGLLDGFNPCSLWVLILMISLLAPMNNRLRMFAIAGAFVTVEGLAYFLFMAAWLNFFLLIGLSRISEIVIAAIALLAGLINLKDFWFYGRGVSLSIPDAAKPGIYAGMRGILQAKNLIGALIGAVILAILVQIVEFMCTSGFPALYTRILTLKRLDSISYYSYLLLYNVAYMFDDVIILATGIITLSQRRLQEREGRWLKLISGMVMVGLAIYLLVTPA
ncbi:glutaredoxin family protein [Methylobacter psychrophilus]|uniref:glutaredoxin family protein n=1 Tax=Methylobacter psychrophilus TaxID=96941 RepID=UPI0021D49600|nr:glutaredoxin domain-containing protein [Methylobacter psychrophilus]